MMPNGDAQVSFGFFQLPSGSGQHVNQSYLSKCHRKTREAAVCGLILLQTLNNLPSNTPNNGKTRYPLEFVQPFHRIQASKYNNPCHPTLQTSYRPQLPTMMVARLSLAFKNRSWIQADLPFHPSCRCHSTSSSASDRFPSQVDLASSQMSSNSGLIEP
uniref:DRBM domain-containing protein n=1 Tax=Panagrellus redivivus TaxID=6233 RepID=A0A7E4UTP8_PANRE